MLRLQHDSLVLTAKQPQSSLKSEFVLSLKTSALCQHCQIFTDMPPINSDALKCVPQAVASNSMLHHDRTAWLADAAPEPRDVIWSNLGWASRWLLM